MNIVIDFTSFSDIFNLPADVLLGKVLFYFGWLPIAITFLWGSFLLWIDYRQRQWAAKNGKYTFLAIDIPRGNEQSPKAVENLFAYLAGAHSTINLIDKYWDGKFQMGFSFEIISIGGYTQFLIRTPIIQRDLVESAIYAQYPDSEITEVDDYTTPFKDVRFPNDKYEIMGGEFIQSKPASYPIKTYEEFEHMMGEPETHFKDPMAALMDLCSSLRPGENLWYQLLIIPIGFDWMDELDKEVSKILGEKPKFTKNILHYGADAALGVITELGNAVMTPVEPAKKEEKKEDALKMMNLKPKQKKRVEGIEKKSGKVAYQFKIRFIYLAEKEIFNKPKVFGGFVGFMKQFAAVDSNNLKPDMDRTVTTSSYLFRKSNLNGRKNRILKNYIGRDTVAGRSRGLLNIEELATIWHFPNEGTVKAPLIQKAPGRKAEPPMFLPRSEQFISEEKAEPLFLGELEEERGVDSFSVSSPEEKPALEKSAAENKEEIEEKEEVDTKVATSVDTKEDKFFSAEATADKGAPPPNLPFI